MALVTAKRSLSLLAVERSSTLATAERLTSKKAGTAALRLFARDCSSPVTCAAPPGLR